VTRAERPSLPNLKEQGSNELAQRFMQYISDSNFEQADTLIVVTQIEWQNWYLIQNVSKNCL